MTNNISYWAGTVLHVYILPACKRCLISETSDYNEAPLLLTSVVTVEPN